MLTIVWGIAEWWSLCPTLGYLVPWMHRGETVHYTVKSLDI
jgi:hypothetical protein